jgi:uncharacterized protein (DUF362 family)
MKVSILRCDNYLKENLISSIKNLLMPFGGIEKLVGKNQRVLLKPNLLFPSPRGSAVNTDPAFVCAVAEMVLEAGAKPVIGDSPAFGKAKQVAKSCGLLDYAKKLGVEIIEFTRPVSISLKDGAFMKKITIDRAVLEADRIINLPKLKTHQQLGFTGAIKNTFGCVNGKRKALMHLLLGHREIDFGKMLIDVHRAVNPALTIVDGVIAMEGAGPRKGEPKKLGLILAGENGIAVDMAIEKIIGIKFKPPYLRAVNQLGLSPGSISEIKIIGDSVEQLKVNDFKFPVFYPIGFSPFRIIKSVAKDLLTKAGILPAKS